MKLPDIVTKLTFHCDGWLIGSSADPSNYSPRDYDVFIPINNWGKASILIPKNAKINTFGGFKFKDKQGNEIDVWTGEMSNFLNTVQFSFAYHPRSGVRLEKKTTK